jgi:hypothetical protein
MPSFAANYFSLEEMPRDALQCEEERTFWSHTLVRQPNTKRPEIHRLGTSNGQQVHTCFPILPKMVRFDSHCGGPAVAGPHNFGAFSENSEINVTYDARGASELYSKRK